MGIIIALVTGVPAVASAASAVPAAEAAERELARIDGAFRTSAGGDLSTLRQLSSRTQKLLASRRLPRADTGLAQLMLAMIERDRVLADDTAARLPGLEAARAYLRLSGETDRGAAAEAWSIEGEILTHPLALADQSDLLAAVDAFSEAVRLSAEDPQARRSAVFNRAAASTFIAGPGAAVAIEGAIRDFESLLADPEFSEDAGSVSLARFNLAGAYMQRQRGDRTVNAEHAITLYQQALAASDRRHDPAGWARVARNLADALLQARLQQPARLDRSVELLTQAVEALDAASRPQAAFDTRLTLADALRRRASWTAMADLDAAAKVLDDARLPPGDQRRLGQLAAAKADLLVSRRADGDESVRPEDVAAAWRAALALTDRARSPRAWASMQNNLGNACNQADRPDLEACARDAYGAALAIRTLADMPMEHFESLTNLGQLEFRRGHWAAAAQIATDLTANEERLFPDLSDLAVAEDAAGRSGRWYENGAYALAKLGRADEAYRMLDAGRARTARQRVGLHDAVLRGAAPSNSLIVAPLITNQGTAVFIRIDGTTKVRFLDDLKGPEVARRISADDVSQPGWLQQYDTAHYPFDQNEAARRRLWSNDVAEMADWMGSRLVQPILAALAEEGVPSDRPIVWSLQGELAILPFSAATLADGRPLVAARPTSLTPSEYFLGLHVSAATEPLLSIANPTADPKLAFAALESTSAVRSAGATARALPAAQATSKGLIQSFPIARVLHFAGHAWHDPDQPDQSFLETADGHLTLATLLAARPADAPDLVVLSACESGRVHVTGSANEFQGLPIGFLTAGAGGVVATLWPVDDLVAFLLMDDFFQRVFQQRETPQAALAGAQNWLRTANGADLAARVRRIRSETATPPAKLDEASAAFQTLGDETPFASAAYWSAFYYTGQITSGVQR